MPQRVHIEDIRTQIEHRATRTQAKIVDGTGILQSEALAIEQLCVRIEAIEVEPRLRRREGDTEVEHLPGCGIKLRVRREGTDLVQLPAKGAHASRLERYRIEFPREALFAECQECSIIRVDAHVHGRLQRNATLHPSSCDGGAKGAKDGLPSCFFRNELGTTDKAVREVDRLLLKP